MAKKKKEEKGKERTFTIPLRESTGVPTTRRARNSVKIIREFLKKNLKTDNVKLDGSLNSAIWSRGIKKPPRKIRVKVTEEEGTFRATPV